MAQSLRVFAFLDLDHPPVAWAVMRGMMVSADYASSPPDPGFISFMQAGMIEHQNNARIFNESMIEAVRSAGFANKTSRMRGMYFFPSRAEAEARTGDPEWPPYFRPENLLELELHCDADPTVADSNWITFAPRGPDGRIPTGDPDWIGRYWRGEAFNSQPVWEIIASGMAIVFDTQVRRRCFEFLKTAFPDSHIPILMARLAGEAGTRGGLIMPFLSREDDRHMRLIYLSSDAEFHDPAVIRAIAAHPDSTFLGRLMSENEEWKIPDFRPWSRRFQLGVQSAGHAEFNVFPAVHHTRGS